MVLTSRAWLLAALVCTAACSKRVPPQRLPTPAELATALVLDPESRGAAIEGPQGLETSLAEALSSRNLRLTRQPLSALGAQTLSNERVKALERASSSPYRLLVEVRTVFFSQIDGRYRWTVGVRLSAARQADGAAGSEEFTLPAVLQYDHQRGPAAVEAVADEISRRASMLFDALIASPPSAPVSAVDRPRSIYFVMIDRFANGSTANDVNVDLADPQAFHGGDLEGLAAHLGWLQDLGVDTVWLSPPFAMRKEKYGPHGAFHGYWVETLDAIEPAFGGDAAFHALADAVHARGMKLVLDVVLNHAAPDGKLVKTRPDWFHHAGGITDWEDPVQLVERDVHGLPDLAQEKPAVRAYLLEGTTRWLGQGGADGLRLDAVKHMPNAFWRGFVADVKRQAGPKAWTLGEQLEGNPTKLAAAWRAGGFDAVFDFPFAFALADVFCKQASPERLAAVLANDRLYPDPSALVTLLDNHDLARIKSQCGDDEAKVQAALTVLLTARGIPSIIWGTEVGLTGDKEPLNRSDMHFERGRLAKAVKALLAARRSHVSLSDGAVAVLEARDRFVALSRVAPTERAVIAVNGAAVAQQLTLPGAGWVDALDGARVDGDAARVAPGEVKVWVAKGDFVAEHARVFAQWTTGARTRRVIFEVPEGAAVSGSGPELGQWNPKAAVKEAHLPVGSVFEFKLVRRAQQTPEWEAGDNRVLFVTEGEGALAVKFDAPNRAGG